MCSGVPAVSDSKVLSDVHVTAVHVARRVDELHEKVDSLRSGSAFAATPRTTLSAASEGALAGVDLVQGVQRLVEDLTRTKSELVSKSERVEQLQQKVTELLDKQERYVPFTQFSNLIKINWLTIMWW